MSAFRDFFEQQNFVEFVLNEFDNHRPVSGLKPWSAKKDQIIGMWRNLRPDMPVYMTPIVKKGDSMETYGEDGIRITGSWNFIAAIMGKIKELLAYESPQTKLRLVFRGVDKSRNPGSDKQSFVFYVNAENRGAGKQRKGFE